MALRDADITSLACKRTSLLLKGTLEVSYELPARPIAIVVFVIIVVDVVVFVRWKSSAVMSLRGIGEAPPSLYLFCGRDRLIASTKAVKEFFFPSSFKGYETMYVVDGTIPSVVLPTAIETPIIPQYPSIILPTAEETLRW